MPIIEVNNVTKEFKLGQLKSLKHTMLNAFDRLRGKEVEKPQPFKALDDVSFRVEQGEVLGIIGHNGAGKSTLLKMLARVSTPTSGNVKVDGRIAPLIEVGAGFVADFTGRENVYLNGAILGMSKQEIDRKFDEIVDFSEVGEFIDTPFKRYSSGMQVKLAFSVATSVEAEILIVDEVLAVGDVAFQRKCLGRMEKMINEEGRTVLIVGHNIRQLERICTRMILLKHGKVECDGEPGKVSKQFLDETTLRPEHGKLSTGLLPSFNNGEIEVESIEVVTDEHVDGTPLCRLFSDLHIRLRLVVPHPLSKVEINFGLHNPEMVFMTKSSTLLTGQNFDLEAGTHTLDVKIERMSLCPGTYGIGLGIYDWTRRPLWAGNGLGWIAVEAPTELVPNLPQSTLTYMPTSWTHTNNNINTKAI